MWCHLCKMTFADQENFKVHIMKEHRPATEFYEDSDTDHFEQKDISEMSDEDNSEIDENEDLIINEQIDEDTGSFSSNENSDADVSENHTRISKTNTRGKKQKYSFFRLKPMKKTNVKFSAKKLKQYKKSAGSLGNRKQLNVVYLGKNAEIKNSDDEKIFPDEQSTDADIPDIVDQLPLPNIKGGFDFNSRNILIWLLKFKEMCRTLDFPLQSKLFKQISAIHKAIFDNYNTALSNDVTSAVMKVYEEFDHMILRHLTSINDQL